MSREKFDGLVPNFSIAYQKIQFPKGGKPGVFSNHEERLFFVLFYLKTYPTFDVLGSHFGLSAGQIHDYVEPFLRVLERALTDLGQLPEVTLEIPEDLSQLVDQYNDIIIDGVEMAYVRPHDEAHQKERYSGKKRHTMKALVISDHQRYVLFTSPLFGGSVHDYTILKKLFDPDLPWFKNLTVRLDLGFLGGQERL